MIDERVTPGPSSPGGKTPVERRGLRAFKRGETSTRSESAPRPRVVPIGLGLSCGAPVPRRFEDGGSVFEAPRHDRNRTRGTPVQIGHEPSGFSTASLSEGKTSEVTTSNGLSARK